MHYYVQTSIAPVRRNSIRQHGSAIDRGEVAIFDPRPLIQWSWNRDDRDHARGGTASIAGGDVFGGFRIPSEQNPSDPWLAWDTGNARHPPCKHRLASGDEATVSIKIMEHPRSALRRTACDICRQQRLKCLRDAHRPSCQRCSRLGKTCVMAEARRAGRPRKPTETSSSSTTEAHASPCASAIASSPVPQTPPHRGPDALPTASFPTKLPTPDISKSIPSPSDTEQFSEFSDFYFSNFSGNRSLPAPPPPEKSVFTNLDSHECFKELSQINIELHALWSVVQAKGPAMTFKDFICDGPSYSQGTGVSMAERTVMASQRFQVTISNVGYMLSKDLKPHLDHDFVNMDGGEGSFDANLNLFDTLPLLERESTTAADAFEIVNDTDRPHTLGTPLVLIIISCYVQLVNIFSELFYCIHAELRLLKSGPIPFIEHLKFIQLGGLGIMDGRLQGMLLCTLVTHLLDRVEGTLGILPDTQRQMTAPLQQTLLQLPHHRELLEKELDNSGYAGRGNPKKLRDTVENLKQILSSDPSW
ncbi:uncharacterized protein JN550_011517 [Neoarthrinium moseri]|uniref:uncharacterized protein n=1 Tax=Neoarthrinium moseri TaxID=1658444 RepID=UPI001FDC1427|nr:uncharacterized protein JN550_011517 [Neoarthrinium moseri]KAI1860365.1 hypothetical protein JN550_011517 [Neoarthrinium moseri]